MKQFLIALIFSALAAAQGLTIDAGGPSDQYFIGGTVFADSTMSPDTTLRYGVNATGFAYSIPTANGFYKITLLMADPNKTAKGQRIFSVWVNGQNLITIDPYASGAIDKQHQATIEVLAIVQAGTLRLDFKPILSNPLVSSIIITPWNPALSLSDLRPGPVVKGSVQIGPFFVDAFTVAHDDDPNIQTKCVPVAGQCPASVEVAPATKSPPPQ